MGRLSAVARILFEVARRLSESMLCNVSCCGVVVSMPVLEAGRPAVRIPVAADFYI